MSYQNVEVLLVEDSDADAEMTLRTLRRRGIFRSSSTSRGRPLVRAACEPCRRR